MRGIADWLKPWLATSESIALATVVQASGSSPRPVGSKMAVTASGQVAGSISGGCVEGAVIEEAQGVLASGRPRLVHYGIANETAWEVGLACGGKIDVYIEPWDAVHTTALNQTEVGFSFGLATRLGGGHLLAWPDGRQIGDPSLVAQIMPLFPGPAAELHELADGQVFLEVSTPPATLVIVGAVHAAITLVRIAQVLGFRTQVLDPRRMFATRERFPTVDELTLAWPQDGLRAEQLGPQHYVVILSHDPKFDLPALEIALQSHAAYVGLIGARFTQADRRQALREAGFSDEALSRIHGPIGLDLGGRRPEEIALAIMAEIVAVIHGRSGGSLRART